MLWAGNQFTMQQEDIMKTRYTVALSVVAGTALGAAAVQGLHAQAKPKAYTVSESETLDATAVAPFVSAIEGAQSAAGGHSLHTRGGRIVTLLPEGQAAPKRVAIVEWDSLEQAQAFYKSQAWDDIGRLHGKAVKTTRRYAVEAVK
jgi:uncharacterized protein (DUF1330 family)